MERQKLREQFSPRNIGSTVVGAITSVYEIHSSEGERGVWFIPALEAEPIAIFTDPSTWETDEDLAQKIREDEIDRRSAEYAGIDSPQQ